jgi:hypothetical protein
MPRGKICFKNPKIVPNNQIGKFPVKGMKSS